MLIRVIVIPLVVCWVEFYLLYTVGLYFLLTLRLSYFNTSNRTSSSFSTTLPKYGNATNTDYIERERNGVPKRSRKRTGVEHSRTCSKCTHSRAVKKVAFSHRTAAHRYDGTYRSCVVCKVMACTDVACVTQLRVGFWTFNSLYKLQWVHTLLFKPPHLFAGWTGHIEVSWGFSFLFNFNVKHSVILQWPYDSSYAVWIKSVLNVEVEPFLYNILILFQLIVRSKLS